MQELAKRGGAFVVNPAVGVRASARTRVCPRRELRVRSRSDCVCVCVCAQPEAISGSSRMKGGSATKILLEAVLSAAHAAAFADTPITPM